MGGPYNTPCQVTKIFLAESVHGLGVRHCCSRARLHTRLGSAALGITSTSRPINYENLCLIFRWYGVGGTIQLAIFGMVAAKVKMNAGGAHTFLEVSLRF